MKAPACVALWLLMATAAIGAQRPQSPSDSVDAAVHLFSDRRFADAEAMLRPLEGRSVRTGDVAFYLGRLAQRRRDYPRAIAMLEQAVAADSTRSGYHIWLARALVQQAVSGSKLKLVFLARRGKKEGDRAIALAPDSIPPRFDMLQYALAAPSFVGGGGERARQQASEIERRNPYWGHIARAKIADHDGAFAESERALRAAIALHPDSAAARLALAESLLDQKRWDDAMAEAREIFARKLDEPAAYFGVGLLGARTMQYANDGLQALRTYLTLRPKEDDPPMASAHYWMGIIYRNLNDSVAARREYEAALALEPTSERAKRALQALAR